MRAGATLDAGPPVLQPRREARDRYQPSASNFTLWVSSRQTTAKSSSLTPYGRYHSVTVMSRESLGYVLTTSSPSSVSSTGKKMSQFVVTVRRGGRLLSCSRPLYS